MNKKSAYWLLISFMISMSLCCSTDKSDWKKAESVNSVVSYNDYLKTHPQGAYARSARSKIDELQHLEYVRSVNHIAAYMTFLERFPQSLFADSVKDSIDHLRHKRHPEFRQARTAEIVIAQSFGESTEVPFHIEEIAKRFLGYAGLKLQAHVADQPDVVLQIEIRGETLHASYQDHGLLYTGAALSGTISFKTSGGFVNQETFEGKVNPPYMMLFGSSDPPPPKTPSSAPWRAVFNEPGSFCVKFVDIIYSFFGSTALIAALGDRDIDMVQSGREKLAKIKDPDTVAPLLAILSTEQISRAAGNAIYVLAEMKDPRTVEPLIAALREEYSEQVAKYLDSMKNNHAEIETSSIRRAAAEALGKLDDPRAVEPLITAMQDRDYFLHYVAAESLQKITGQNFGIDQEKWLAWWEKNKATYLAGR